MTTHKVLLSRSYSSDTKTSCVDQVELGVASRTPQHRRNARSCGANALDLLGSCYIALASTFTAHSLLGCALAVTYTVAYWALAPNLAINMNWNIVSLAVIFPISQCIGMGFSRRERALSEFGHMLGNVRAIWAAVQSWQLKNDQGRFVRAIMSFEDPELAGHQVRALFEEFLTALAAYFAVERWNRARHNAPCCHRDNEEQQELIAIAHEQRLRVDHAIGRMQRLVQQLKIQGLPGGEAHRVDQYVSKVGISFEQLCVIKEYRTPQAFRAFARVYILVIGALYGPDYLHVGKLVDVSQSGDLGSAGSNSLVISEPSAAIAGDGGSLAFALVFACSIQLVLSGLFHIMLGLEDPFIGKWPHGHLDSINVPQLIEVARRQLLGLEADATQDWTVHSEPAKAKSC